MARAIEISRQGFPAPNPHVGCVLERGGEIVGEGFHDHAGGPHAEVVALTQARERAMGSTAYVTLEPCNFTGRTGPCSEALIRAGVSRVVIACAEPNSKAMGGAERLRSAGIEVIEGVMADEAAAANEAWLKAMMRKSPFVVVKAAASLDGRIALSSGESKWITGELAREAGHRLRADCGSVLVGRKTVETDNPHLSARIPGVTNPPIRIVLDGDGRLDSSYQVFDDTAETLHFSRHPGEGCIVGPVIGNSFDLPTLMSILFDRGITGVLVEGGAHTIASFVRADLVDRYELFLGGRLLGNGLNWYEDVEVEHLSDAPALEIIGCQVLGPDLRITARPVRPNRGNSG